MKTIRIIKVVGSLFGLAIVGAVVAVNFIDLNSYKTSISEQAKTHTGRDLVIGGDINLSVGLSTKLIIEKVSFSNADFGTRKQMVSADLIEAELSVLPLIFGNIDVQKINLIKPNIWLETDKKGQSNWVMTEQPAEPSNTDGENEASNSALPKINNISITKGEFSYRDGKTGEVSTLLLENLSLTADSFDAPLNIELAAALNDKKIEASGVIDSLHTVLSGESSHVDINTNFDGLALALKSSLQITDKEITLSSSNLYINGNELLLSASIKPDTSTINADISFDTFDLDKLPAGTSETVKTDKLFSANKLDLKGLRKPVVSLSISGKRIVSSNLSIANFKSKLSVSKGVATFNPSMEAGGGNINGKIVANTSGNKLALSINVVGKKINLGQMLSTAGTDEVIKNAHSDLSITLKGKGGSISSVMANLSGQVLVDVGKGELNNKHINLAGSDLVAELISALNPFADKEEFTALECAVVNIYFDKGLSDYDKQIAVVTDKMTIVSSGEFDLKNETLDVKFSPKPRKDSADLGLGAGELVSAVKLTGTLANPELGLDAVNTAKATAKVYRAIASGGTSLILDGLLDKIIADGEPCKTARDARASSAKSAPAQIESQVNDIFGF